MIVRSRSELVGYVRLELIPVENGTENAPIEAIVTPDADNKRMMHTNIGI